MERIQDTIEDKFGNELRKGLEEALNVKKEQQVSIPVSEYVILKQKERDLELLATAIMDDLELSYDKEELKISGGNNTVRSFKTLYNTCYKSILGDFKAKEEVKGDD